MGHHKETQTWFWSLWWVLSTHFNDLSLLWASQQRMPCEL